MKTRRFATVALLLALPAFAGCALDTGEADPDGESLGQVEQGLTTSSYRSTADTFINEAAPTTSYGLATYLSVRGGAGTRRVTYMRFDLTPPAGKVAQSAVLKVKSGGYAGSDSTAGGTIRLFAPTNAMWAETTVDGYVVPYTWNAPLAGSDASGDLSSLGAVSATGGVPSAPGLPPNQYSFTNIASAVPTGDGATWKHVTFVIRSTNADDAGFFSRNYQLGGSGPQLWVTWAP